MSEKQIRKAVKANLDRIFRPSQPSQPDTCYKHPPLVAGGPSPLEKKPMRRELAELEKNMEKLKASSERHRRKAQEGPEKDRDLEERMVAMFERTMLIKKAEVERECF